MSQKGSVLSNKPASNHEEAVPKEPSNRGSVFSNHGSNRGSFTMDGMDPMDNMAFNFPPPRVVSFTHAGREHLTTMFNNFDDDLSGFLTLEELVSLSFALGLERSIDEITADFADADNNADGKVSIKEFLSWFKTYGTGVGSLKTIM